MKVTLREKAISHNRISLYLDYFPPITNPETGKQTRREFLSLYVYQKPRTELDREHNKETRLLAANICAKRQLDLQGNAHGFVSKSRKSADFLKFFQSVVDERADKSNSARAQWQLSHDYFSDFQNGKCTFGMLDENLVERYRLHLLKCPSKRSPKTCLSQNTAKALFDRFCSTVKTARDRGLLTVDPTRDANRILERETTPEFFTLEELKMLADTSTDYLVPDDLRRAALFSALTGLRFSDIAKLVWSEIETGKDGTSLNFNQKKTGRAQFLPISDEARALLPYAPGKPSDRIFPDLKYSAMTSVYLGRWLVAAKISKPATFHAFRHTFATAQLTLDTDLYTVSKMLGHSSIRQTEKYARIVDEKKRAAANKISLK